MIFGERQRGAPVTFNVRAHMETVQAIAQWVGGIILAGGSLVLIILGAFKFLAAKWLEAKFRERLEAFKHEQAKEIERIRFRINSLLDRATKLHQREFEVLPQAWSLLVDSFHQTQALTSPLQQYPDLWSLQI